MSLSDRDLQMHVGLGLDDVRKELESQGYIVQEVRRGSLTNSCVPPATLQAGPPPSKPQKRAIISYNGADPDHKVLSIKQEQL